MIKTLAELASYTEIDLDQLEINPPPHFPIKVPKHFAKQIEKGNANDPLLKQVIPQNAPYKTDFTSDPVGDLQKNPVPSLIHKYQGRALMMVSPRCDIHCRYCFRQHFPYQQVKQSHWDQALAKIAEDTSIEEVIFSGGDPFTLSESTLIDLAEKVAKIHHITTLRIHSRTPIAAPDQAPISQFIHWVKQTRLKLVLVVHCNHANELSEQTQELFNTYRQAGITLLNQTVLLKGVNDQTEILASLSKALFQQGVLPYYCHLLDKVQGAEAFDLPEDQAWQIFEALRQQLPGYLVPRLVREIAGEPYKTIIY